MIDGVTSVRSAVRQCFIRYIHSIFAVDGHIGSPTDGALLRLLAYYVGHAEGALCKWVLKVFIFGTQIGKALSIALLPCLGAIALGIDRVVFCYGAVGLTYRHIGIVIHHYLIGISVALAWCHHNGTRILQHRYHVRQDIALCIFVFYALEHTSALPLPASQALLIIQSVALPHGNVLAIEAMRRCVGAVEVAHQRCGGRICKGWSAVFAVLHITRYEGAHILLIGHDGDGFLCTVGGQHLFDVGHDLCQVIMTDREIREVT